jgi:hypothetical protein
VNVTEIRTMLNLSAAMYSVAKNQNEKREALATYLHWLQVLATGESFFWSMTKSGGNATEDLRRRVHPEGEPPLYDLRPAMELEEALLAVNNRENPSLFQPPKLSGKPTPRENVYWWAHASALITTLMQRFHRSERDAATVVAEEMGKRKLPLPGKATTKTPAWKLLQTWRDKCMAGEKGQLASYWYEMLVGIGTRINATADELIKADTNPLKTANSPSCFCSEIAPHIPCEPLHGNARTYRNGHPASVV